MSKIIKRFPRKRQLWTQPQKTYQKKLKNLSDGKRFQGNVGNKSCEITVLRGVPLVLRCTIAMTDVLLAMKLMLRNLEKKLHVGDLGEKKKTL